MATGYSFGSAVRPVVSSSNSATFLLLPGLCLLLEYRNYYTTHRSPYMSVYVSTHSNWKYISTAQIGKKLVHGVCVARIESKGTGRRYGLHSSASISGHNISVTVLGLLKKEKKKELVQNGISAVFRLAT